MRGVLREPCALGMVQPVGTPTGVPGEDKAPDPIPSGAPHPAIEREDGEA
jgi:hypothetical protein